MHFINFRLYYIFILFYCQYVFEISLRNPFFTENQAGVNPHDTLTCKESAKIIIGHVTEGVKIAEKANLPTIIKDFILTHHGRGMAKDF